MESNKNNRPGKFDIDMSPFRDLMGQMDSFFNESFKHMNSVFNLRPFWVDVNENESEFIVTAELPGYKRDEIELEMIGNRLRIAAEAGSIHNETNNNNKSQSYQQMERSITLPFPIPKEKTRASFHDGLLKVTIPKKDINREYIDIIDENS
ncbi:Hsp20/alpha crystallin family protein [Lentibacillus sp. CBA3610]|uniref:Hsp20/alpha crystallin family protein n=1 Tax=Lentibacillus sp. CBA3610 TaxID=2518176 RepID=UPI001595527A|nr:Hsp20/alpha crystallin family protein [Lentibacillus sp. CBA3610]QKY68836.1 Hsp20/alpha crystallin family protein [Lentibacillus sp. CBA3610]